jgi:HK97 family phage major capsid protein
MSKISELTSKRNKLIADCQVLVNAGKAASPEYRAMIAELDETTEHVQLLERAERHISSMSPAPVATPPAASAVIVQRDSKERRSKLNAAWRSYFRGESQNTAEFRDILTITSSDGAPLIPQEYNGFVATALKYYAPMTQFVRTRFSSNGRAVKVSKVDDTGNGLNLIVEGSSTPVPEADPTFSSVVVSTDLFTAGQIRYSNQLAEDSAFDVETFLTGLADIRYGRGLEKILTLGTDSSGTTTPNNPGLLNIAQTATTTASLAAGIGWSDLVATFDSLDADYLPKSIWQMSSRTRNYLAGLKDSTGRPYFTPATDGGFDYLLGRPIVINQSLPLYSTANATPILFGSLWDGFQMITSELRVQTIHERYAEFNESSLIVSTRVGSTGLVSGAIKALKLAAS